MWISLIQTICKFVCVSSDDHRSRPVCLCKNTLLPCSLLTESQYYNFFFFTSFGKESVLSHLFAFALECLQNRRAELLADLENHISKYVLLRWTSIFKGWFAQHPGHI